MSNGRSMAVDNQKSATNTQQRQQNTTIQPTGNSQIVPASAGCSHCSTRWRHQSCNRWPMSTYNRARAAAARGGNAVQSTTRRLLCRLPLSSVLLGVPGSLAGQSVSFLSWLAVLLLDGGRVMVSVVPANARLAFALIQIAFVGTLQ